MKLAIATGNSRKEKTWKNKEISWPDFLAKVRSTYRTSETVAEYKRLPKARQDDIKDVGVFVGGRLKDGRRRTGFVEYRSMLTLDMDYADPGIWEQVSMFFDFACCIYSTHKHTPDKPRLRLIVPLSRNVSADEYMAVARKVAEDIGIEQFDDTTYEPTRLMYWPSTSADGQFVFESQDGVFLDPDSVLSGYKDWKDTSSWPVSSRQTSIVKRMVTKQIDPLEKPGIIGAFCRSYTVQDAIDKFISDIYKPSMIEGRYDYTPADSTAGVLIYDDKFAYSHHATDPACGKLCNSFDLIRLHKFGELDGNMEEDTSPTKLPSFKAMTDIALKDVRVKEQFAKERRAQAESEFIEEDWQEALELDKTGAVKDSFGNYLLILNNDPNLRGIVFNQLRDGVDVHGEIPWKRLKPGWSETDGAKLYEYLQNHFGIYSPTKTNNAVMVAAATRHFHPIREYLNTLPAWDCVPRVETLLVDYFGAEDTTYTRAVTRKTFAAAVARIYQPGMKFDYMLVINGATGLGKSTFFSKLAGQWFSDSLTFADMGKGKDAPEKIQGFWIIEIPELAGIRKTDVNNVKAFLSRCDDNYRASYGYATESHPRQCIIVGSTNSESAGFLRDVTGNRRFWPVRVSGRNARCGWDITDLDVLQIWAEAKLIWKRGEKLYLEGADAKVAVSEQANAMESDEREGLVREYLDMLLPQDWDILDVYRRRDYFRDQDDPTRPCGINRRDVVSNIEIWCECLGKSREDVKIRDSYEITAIMQKMSEWRRGEKKVRISGYGPQNIWLRNLD